MRLSASFFALALASACGGDGRTFLPPPCAGLECCTRPDCCPPGAICEDFPPTDPARLLPALQQADAPPVPIAGGTLTLASSGAVALAGDPDRDSIYVVDLRGAPAVLATLELRSGDEPGRIVEEPSGDFLVVLRGAGEIARIDAESWTVAQRERVCASPRGLAVDGDTIFTTCTNGDLVTLSSSLKEQSRTRIARDLRDVVVVGSSVFLSLFKTAEVLELDRETFAAERHVLRDPFDPNLSAGAAYRMIPSGNGTVLVLHQLARTEGEPVRIEVEGGYGGGGCNPSIVQAAVTEIGPDFSTRTTSLGNLVVPVDLAVSGWGAELGGQLAIAAAGSRTDNAGSAFATTRAFLPPAPAAAMFRQADVAIGPLTHCSAGGETFADGRRVTAVAYNAAGSLVMLTRAPNELVIPGVGSVALEGRDVFDTGHELFFGDAGGGIACASCHLEGGEDGKVWTFEGVGPRRTQDIRGGILGSEPFHWDGDMASFEHLASDVFDQRMLGPNLPPDYAGVFASWIDAQPMPVADPPVDLERVDHGRAIFESAETGCTTCHGGPRFQSPISANVGTGSYLQVPSLVGVVHRAPFMHDGCAATLEERFTDPSCGGTNHGNTAGLDEVEISDLVAYLETL